MSRQLANKPVHGQWIRALSAMLACAATLAACGDASSETTSTGLPTSTAVGGAGAEGSVYSTSVFVLPFEVAMPTWLGDTENTEEPNFVTWSPSEDVALSERDLHPAVRFLIPVVVYPPGDTEATPPPDDYLAYLLAQSEHGASLEDVTETTVGGSPATIVSATVADSLDGSLGCPAEGITAHDCFGLQPDLTLRIAVIDVGGTTLLAWLRHAEAAGEPELTREIAAFEEMLATVHFIN